MANFPSRWFDFTTQKELKRLRIDINDTLSLKIEIAASLILTIVGCFVEDYIEDATLCTKIILCVIFCALIILIFTIPYIGKYIKHRKRCNVIINGKDAIDIFDDEVVYNVLVAYEYFLARSNIANNIIKSDINNFYNLETKYYLSTAIKRLSLFSARMATIFNDKDNLISIERVYNITNIIDKLIIDPEIDINPSIKSDYDVFKKLLSSL